MSQGGVAELAWLAGIVDGEGAITIYKLAPRSKNQSERFDLSLCVEMTSQETIQRVRAITGLGSVHNRVRLNRDGWTHKHPTWCWKVSGTAVGVVLEAIAPYLVTKRRQALLALQFRSRMSYNPRKAGLASNELAAREVLREEMRALNALKN